MVGIFGFFPGSRRVFGSLRLRLVLIPTAIIYSGLILSLVLAVFGARSRVADEADTSIKMGRILAGAAIVNVTDAGDVRAALVALSRDLPTVRHLSITVFEEDGSPLSDDLSRPEAGIDVPDWFVGLLGVTEQAEYMPVVKGGRLYGSIGIRSNSLDEIEEIWRELRFLIQLLVGISLLTGVLILISVGKALRPIQELGLAFDRLERGDFDCAVTPMPVAELSRIGEQFNSLIRSLKQVTDDNHRLIEKMTSMQEAERKEIAQELHDEIGPVLFGIRADITWLTKRARAGDLSARDMEERGHDVMELVDSIQRVNGRLLERLYPQVLTELGLSDALRQLVTTWRHRYPDLAIDADIAADTRGIGEEMSLKIFRAAQECLTNVVRHAQAGAVWISLTREDGETGRGLRFEIRDDGRAVLHPVKFGIGLLGIRKRVHACGGRLSVGAGDNGAGTKVEIVLPTKETGDAE